MNYLIRCWQVVRPVRAMPPSPYVPRPRLAYGPPRPRRPRGLRALAASPATVAKIACVAVPLAGGGAIAALPLWAPSAVPQGDVVTPILAGPVGVSEKGPPTPIPEPATLWVFAVFVGMLVLIHKRR